MSGTPYDRDPDDMLTVHHLKLYNIGKAVLVNGIWHKVRRQRKAQGRPTLSNIGKSLFLLTPEASYHADDPEIRNMILNGEVPPLNGNGWVSFRQIVDAVNDGGWGFMHTKTRDGTPRWFGAESPRHEGRHDDDFEDS